MVLVYIASYVYLIHLLYNITDWLLLDQEHSWCICCPQQDESQSTAIGKQEAILEDASEAWRSRQPWVSWSKA